MRKATWVWTADDLDARFAIGERVSEAFVSVSATGPDAAERRLVTRFRDAGIAVAALGSGAEWVDDPALAATWARTVAASESFASVHLDVEPWARPDWDDHPADLLAALTEVVHAVRRATGLAVDVDLPPWLAVRHPASFAALAAAASAVTLLAYRTTSDDILTSSADARRHLAGTRRSYRIGVDTSPPTEPGTSFAGLGRRALDRALQTVAAADPACAGFAVHDLRGWTILGS